MGCPWYLAVTAAELPLCALPAAWMSCRFSPWGKGLSNLPAHLPPDSLVILDDQTPMDGHDPQAVTDALAALCQRLSPAGVLLDFQRPDNPRAAALATCLSHTLPCPVAITELYAKEADCAVLVSAPMHLPLPQVLQPWQGRRLWLDVSLGCQALTVTREGTQLSPAFPVQDYPHYHEKLHCRYHTRVAPDKVVFTLCRTREQLPGLLAQAQALGVELALGLYQEYATKIPPQRTAEQR